MAKEPSASQMTPEQMKLKKFHGSVESVIKAADGDAIVLLDAAWQLANSPRYRRNNHLTQVTRGYAVQQNEMKSMQDRIDERLEKDEARRVERKKRQDAEAKKSKVAE